MAALARMRQLEERQVEKEIQDMLWSPKMDILALQWKSGQEVSLYRYNWQRLWTASPPSETSLSTSFVWRPDGKMLAIGYDDSQVSVLDVESHIPVTIHKVDGTVSCLSWTLHVAEISGEDHDDSAKEVAVKQMFSETNLEGWEFLTSFPSLSKAYSGGSEEKEECQKLHDGGLVTLLAAGTKNGFIHLFINGFLPCSKIDLNFLLRNPIEVTTIGMSTRQFATFTATVRFKIDDDVDESEKDESVRVIAFNIPLLASCIDELKTVSHFFCVIDGILKYMSDTLKQIGEAWESVLLEMDSKLESFAEKLPAQDGMAADFLELLVFGVPSPELESFLQTDLTEKGLKKFDHSIEVSYSNIQRLVLTYLNTVSQSLNFHLAEMVGHCRASNKFEAIGVQEECIIEAEQWAATFWSKGLDVQQVLDDSLKSFKAFFRWLSVEIRRISDLCMADDLMKVSQQDVRFIADFLNSLSSSADQTSKTRYLEKVGQYLKGDTITQPLDRRNNPWFKFLLENPGIRDLPFIISVDQTASPLRVFQSMKESIETIFSGVNLSATEHCKLWAELKVSPRQLLPDNESLIIDCRQFESLESGKVLGLVMHKYPPSDGRKERLLFYEIDVRRSPSIRALWLSLTSESANSMKLIDCQFYTSELISLLLQTSEDDEDRQQMIQLNYSLMEPYLVELKFLSFNHICLDIADTSVSTMSVFDFADQSCRRDLEHMLACQFAVSPRKVAAFLFKNKRRIRIYDMEAEEEEDPDDDTAGTSAISNELNTST